jgi:hypothetical protein
MIWHSVLRYAFGMISKESAASFFKAEDTSFCPQNDRCEYSITRSPLLILEATVLQEWLLSVGIAVEQGL